MSTNTPNLNLLLPTIGVDTGLVWEQSANANSSILDGHDHTPGNGFQITPNGLNINADLSLGKNSLINSKAIVFAPQPSFASLDSLYVISGDLFFNDGASNVVQLTSGGLVNATSSGISSGSASASFVSSVLVVNAAANTPANIQAGSILLGNNSAGSKFLTLSPPSAMASNYQLNLPSLPGATSVLSLDTSGNIATGAAGSVSANDLATGSVTTVKIVDANVTTAKIADASITTAKIVDASITKTKLAALGQQISSSSGNFSTSSLSLVNVTNLSVTITTTGRPVWIGLMPDGAGLSGLAVVNSTGFVSMFAEFVILNGSTAIATTEVQGNAIASVTVPVGSLWVIDTPSASTITYTVQASMSASATSAVCKFAKLVAYEIG